MSTNQDPKFVAPLDQRLTAIEHNITRLLGLAGLQWENPPTSNQLPSDVLLAMSRQDRGHQAAQGALGDLTRASESGRGPRLTVELRRGSEPRRGWVDPSFLGSEPGRGWVDPSILGSEPRRGWVDPSILGSEPRGGWVDPCVEGSGDLHGWVYPFPELRSAVKRRKARRFLECTLMSYLP